MAEVLPDFVIRSSSFALGCQVAVFCENAASTNYPIELWNQER